MAHGHAATIQPEKLNLGSVGGRLGTAGLFIGVVALVAAAWQGLKIAGPTPELTERLINHFFHSYLAAYSFFMAITLGALMFTMLHHLARAGWSVTVRRLAEGLALNVFLMVLLMVPFFIKVNGIDGVHRLLEWLNEGPPFKDTVLQSKAGYMNSQFFAIRMGGYFLIWCFLAWYFSAKSAQQDGSGDYRISIKLEKLSAPGMILFGFSLTAFAFDWIMALNPHWFSTIFGVYYFAGALLSALSMIVLLSLALQQRGLLGNAVNHEHYHDLGKLMFAFTFFWGYVAFAQYMLIWYSNLPEETQFYIPRQIGYWGSLTLVLLAVHLLIPFPGLLSRHMKRRNALLAFWAVWSLCACALDQYWLVVPNQWINKIPAEVGNPDMSLQASLHLLVKGTNQIYQVSDAHQSFVQVINYPFEAKSILLTVLCFVGIGGLYVFSTMFAMRNKSLVPTKDPRLNESLAFENM